MLYAAFDEARREFLANVPEKPDETKKMVPFETGGKRKVVDARGRHPAMTSTLSIRMTQNGRGGVSMKRLFTC